VNQLKPDKNKYIVYIYNNLFNFRLKIKNRKDNL